MTKYFIWKEERLQASGYAKTYVLSFGSKTCAICRRNDRTELERLMDPCQSSGLKTLPELKASVRKGVPKQDGAGY